MKARKPRKHVVYLRENEPLTHEEIRLIIKNDWLTDDKMAHAVGRSPILIKSLRKHAESVIAMELESAMLAIKVSRRLAQSFQEYPARLWRD